MSYANWIVNTPYLSNWTVRAIKQSVMGKLSRGFGSYKLSILCTSIVNVKSLVYQFFDLEFCYGYDLLVT